MEPGAADAAGGLVWADEAANRLSAAARHSTTIWNRTGFTLRQGVKGATWLQRRCDGMMTARLISDENANNTTSPKIGFRGQRKPANLDRESTNRGEEFTGYS